MTTGEVGVMELRATRPDKSYEYYCVNIPLFAKFDAFTSGIAQDSSSGK